MNSSTEEMDYKTAKAVAKAKRPFYKKKRVIIPAAAVLILGVSVAGTGTDDSSNTSTPDTSSQVTEKKAGKPETAPAPEVEAAPEVELTSGQQRAVDKAEEYLDLMAYSKSGLAGQLEFEGFTKGEAQFAVNHLDVDWTEQAKVKAQEYLDLMSYSKTALVDQLEFEGFTTEQATAAVDAVY